MSVACCSCVAVGGGLPGGHLHPLKSLLLTDPRISTPYPQREYGVVIYIVAFRVEAEGQ